MRVVRFACAADTRTGKIRFGLAIAFTTGEVGDLYLRIARATCWSVATVLLCWLFGPRPKRLPFSNLTQERHVLRLKVANEMDASRILALLREIESGAITPEGALRRLEHLPFVDLGIARVDHHRALRQGMPEVVFGESKTAEQIVLIGRELLKGDGRLLVTRVASEKAALVRKELPELEYEVTARALIHVKSDEVKWRGTPVVIVTAGTSDLPVAEEACQTLRVAGVPVERVYDAGVAGLHRIMGDLAKLEQAPAVVVVAGMEGALPSVVGGLIRAPIIAVPSSIGYGAALSGFTALLGMLSSCAAGLTVVNIDNGFGAAMAVLRILDRLSAEERAHAR